MKNVTEIKYALSELSQTERLEDAKNLIRLVGYDPSDLTKKRN